MRSSARAKPGAARLRVSAPAVSGASPRLYVRAFEILAGRIADGSLPADTKLLESHIAQDFGISRAPARQALGQLEQAGLVVRAEGHGYLVRGATRKGALHAHSPAPLAAPIRLAAAPSWERIYSEIESAIAARTAIGSWRVIESELAKYYGVSRTVARDVIARMHQRGVIKKDDKSRWYAPALTPDYVAELYEMRWLLEPVALTDALRSVPPGFIAGVRRHLEASLARAEELDGAALDALEDELHVRLLGHCGNRTLMDALRLYQSLLIAHSFLYGQAPHLYPVEPFLPEHLKIVERAEAGHAAEAARALEEHLRASLDRAVARIDVVGREFRPEMLPYLAPLQPRKR
ncbi:MAG TPA: GntR family transcriptional regulator [Alphaproteobacteria bacterium]|nr:GntR family transcriptional regulator [Alphaproteobacteria bacterium]